MNTVSPKEIVKRGAEILATVLTPHGFAFEFGDEGNGSGGAFAQGRFVKGDAVLEFSFRYALGCISYRLQGSVIDHENYLRYSGNWKQRKYPNVGLTPEESFAALAGDLKAFFSDFTNGSGDVFKLVVAARDENPDRFKGFAALDNYT
jgi:hypothetical protein